MSESSDAASIREVHALIDTAEAKILARIDQLKSEMAMGFERHDVAHASEERRRTTKFRWAVGTALGVGGLLGGFANHLFERLT